MQFSDITEITEMDHMGIYMICKAVVYFNGSGWGPSTVLWRRSWTLFGLVKAGNSLNIQVTACLSETTLVRGFSVQYNNTLAW